MAEIDWNDFIDKHTKPFAFAARVSANLPKRVESDKNGKTLPEPYDLFRAWCRAYLTGEWTTKERSDGFLLCVSKNEDAKAITDEFKIIGQAKIAPAGKDTYPIGYTDLQYAALAGDLGYVI